MRPNNHYILPLLAALAASGVASAQRERTEPPVAEVEPAPNPSTS